MCFSRLSCLTIFLDRVNCHLVNKNKQTNIVKENQIALKQNHFRKEKKNTDNSNVNVNVLNLFLFTIHYIS